jgi:hypothetical protein
MQPSDLTWKPLLMRLASEPHENISWPLCTPASWSRTWREAALKRSGCSSCPYL